MTDKTTLKSMGISEKFINESCLKEIKKLNFGTKVKKDNIITLDEVMNIYKNTNFFIIINTNNNPLIIQRIINGNYSNNIYIEIKNNIHLKLTNTNFKIGTFVDCDNDWNNLYDFYEVEYSNNLNIDEIENKIYNNKKIFISNVLTEKNFIDLYNQLSNLINNVYIITPYPNLIKKNINIF